MKFENRVTESKLLGDVLKKLRKDNGYSQNAIAEYLDINRTTYTKYELGRIPDAMVIAKLAQLYGVSADSIVEVCLDEAPPLDSLATLRASSKENAVCILSKDELLLVRYYRDSLRKDTIFDYAQGVYLEDCENFGDENEEADASEN